VTSTQTFLVWTEIFGDAVAVAALVDPRCTTAKSSYYPATATASKTRAKTCSEPTRPHDLSDFDDRQPPRLQRPLTGVPGGSRLQREAQELGEKDSGEYGWQVSG
jgi:hypothetical protein